MPAELPGRRGRHRAGIDREEIAPGRQHVGPAAASARRSGRARRRRPSRPAQQRRDFGRAAGGHRRRKHAARSSRARRAVRVPRAGSAALARDQPQRQHLQPLDRVARGAPARPLTRSPEASRPRASVQLRGSPGPAVQRVEAELRDQSASGAEIEIDGDRPHTRPRRRAAARGERHQQLGRAARRRALCPKTCRPSRICSSFSSHRWPSSLRRARRRRRRRAMPQSRSMPGAAARSRISARERRDAARIAARGLVILVDQPLELGLRAVALGAGQRRGQMIDDHRRGAPLRLAALARDR